MEQCNVLEALINSFAARLAAIKLCSSLTNNDNETILTALRSNADALEVQLGRLKEELVKQKALKTTDHPGSLDDASKDSQNSQKTSSGRSSGTSEGFERPGMLLTPVLPTPESERVSRPKIKSNCQLLFLPSLEYLHQEEFDAISKYMKGRLTLAKVNGGIDEFNKSLEAKYKLLHTPKCKLSLKLKDKVLQYHEQETKETKGQHFTVDNDLKENSAFKLDSNGRAILTILRHCGRIHEIRGGKLVRYVVRV